MGGGGEWRPRLQFKHVKVEMYIIEKCQLGNWVYKFATQWRGQAWGYKFGSCH